MKIGIIGSGTVGSSLGKALTRAGHTVMFSSRTPDSGKMATLLAECGGKAQAGTVAETLAFSDTIAIAMRWDAIPDMVRTAGDWSGKIVIDMTNRFGPPPIGSAGSAGLDLAKLTGARVVKAFNIIGAEHYQNPVFGSERATMLIAGDDAEAKRIVSQLAGDIGFDVVDAGDSGAIILLENLAALWVHLAGRAGHGRNIALRLIRR